jgi:hypothetical protein
VPYVGRRYQLTIRLLSKTVEQTDALVPTASSDHVGFVEVEVDAGDELAMALMRSNQWIH